MTPTLTAPDQQTREDIASMLSIYFDGIYNGDTVALGRVLHPKAIYVCATDGTLTYLTMAEYFPIVEARLSPASRDETRNDRIISIDLAGPVTAIACVRISMASKEFINLLSLIFVDGRWQIIAKVLHYDLDTGGH
jgi:Putative lumazine-binding